ncbi:MAG: hypothetical protein UV67_C0015G0022 [Parcubacteria group bacterium GW2011_GWC1_43_12]|nr:MAG: hypothetical protein UV34_C0030G0002 [Parcubacteria group bacterium GW2011_GWB1_42_6]KKS91903.1 MAG: hypothetical protein UV67_C0015G0022 [Parcubacteria group bacterium GW2011_GWC1_43_12]
MPKVFIIIVNFNGWPDTLECLGSLEKVDYDNFEVVLIDNASTEKPPLYSVIPGLTRNLKVRQIYNDFNLGFAGANNQGIKMAQGCGADYILLLNNDTTVEPDFLNKLVEAAQSDDKIGIIGPYIYYYDDPAKIQFAGGKINWSKTRGEHILQLNSDVIPAKAGIQINSGLNSDLDSRFRGNDRPVSYITGCALMTKREVVEKIGPLSEDYFLYYEDTDWCQRAKNAGYKCAIVPESKIYHKQSKSAGEFSYPYIYYHSRNGLIFGWKFGPKIIVAILSVWIFLKQIIKYLTGYKRAWARPVMKGVVDFWKRKRGKLEGYY